MDPKLAAAARDAIGFMPENEGLALYKAGLDAGPGPMLEIGSYCGKSAVYLGAAARVLGTVLYSIDHHRGSEEHQKGEMYRDERLVDAETGRVDTLPAFRSTIATAGLEDVVVGMVGRSEVVAANWSTSLGLIFIDGGHSDEAVETDLRGWVPHLVANGLLVIHDVFEDPADGGQAPYRGYLAAVESREFVPAGAEGSLRVLKRVGQRF